MKKIFINSFHKIRVIWRFILFVLIFMALNIPLQLGLRTVIETVIEDKLLIRVLSVLILFLSVITSLFIQIKFLDKSSFTKYGLALNLNWFKEFFIGCGIAAFQLSIFFVAMYICGYVENIDYFVTNNSNAVFMKGFLSELLVQLFHSTVEEILFRAFLFYITFEALRPVSRNSKKRAILSCILNSFVFGAFHLLNENVTILAVINLSFDGLMICLPFLITSRLGMSIGLHFSWNFVQGAIFGFANSGYLAKASIFSVNMPDNLLTGGLFGPEGSILLLALDGLAVILILIWKKSTKIDSWINPLIVNNGNPINH